MALGLIVVVLVIGNDDGESTTGATRGNPAGGRAEVEPICRVEESGGDARLDLSASDLLCPEGRAIIGSIQRQIDAGLSGVLEAGDWICSQRPFAEYPILTHCQSSDGRTFDVVGLAPSARMSQTEIEATELEEAREQRESQSRGQFFYTPSANIGCAMLPDSVRCDIREKRWKPPPKPGDCMLDWGNSVSISAAEGSRILCAGDTLLGGTYGELPYGNVLRRGAITCVSRSAGLTCMNENGSGFFLSYQRLTLF
jgi:hypothetical protein